MVSLKKANTLTKLDISIFINHSVFSFLVYYKIPNIKKERQTSYTHTSSLRNKKTTDIVEASGCSITMVLLYSPLIVILDVK